MRLGAIDLGSTVLKYTFPEWTATIFGTTPGDYNEMNNGMRYGFVWDVAPRHYDESVDEPLTRPFARYVSELIRIRKQYADLLFFERLNDTMGATVHGGTNVRYSVFKPLQLGKSGEACVVVNFDTTPQTVDVSLDGLSGDVEIARPFQPVQTAALPVRLTIPPHQLAIVVQR
jgi:hypothetical protein